MKTIKERAKQYAPDPFDPDYILPTREQYIVNQQRSAYITGAMEQKAIDIEKACEWLKNNWREYVYQDRDGMILFGFWESDFRKAMEK